MSAQTPVIDRIASLGIIPVVELRSHKQVLPLLNALLRAGIDIVEVTLRTEAGLAAIELLRSRHDEVVVGGGTVRTPEEAARVLDAGADFVVSPSTNTRVIELCRSRGVAVFPGACTPTEIDQALAAGADAIKFFPAEAMGGIPFLKALAGPFRGVSFLPTGGIGPSNFADYLRLTQVVACGGSWMVAPPLLAAERFDEIEELSRQAVAIASAVRDGSSERTDG
jgi:2-dehydro-3-deoxyphosphogluconate aldolase/(4S)-4-hydroxy-2-oxoglutarate aldolase